MAGEIAYKLTADEAQALQAVSRLSREFGLNETAIKKSVEATKELDRTQQQMGREAAKVFADTRTPIEQHQQQLKKLDELHKQNKIDAETYGRAVKQATDGYESSLKNVHQQQKQCFGSESLLDIASFAVGLLSIGTAVGAVKTALEGVQKMKDKAGEDLRQNERPFSVLAQVSDRDPEENARLIKKAETIAKSAGISEKDAANLVFKAASARQSGGLDDLDLFAELAGQGQTNDPAELLEKVSTIKTAAGEKSNLSRRDIMSKLVAVGENSFKSVEQIAPAVAGAVTGSKEAGVSLDEVMGAIAYTSMANDPELARTRQVSLQKSLAKLRSPSMAGKSSGYTQEQYDKESADLDQEKRNLQHEITAEQRKMTGSQRKAADPARWDAQHAALKKKTEALHHKKGTISHDLEVDEDGHPLDANAKQLRAAASAALIKAGPGLFSQLHAIEGLKLDPAQKQKLLGRQESVQQMGLLLENEEGVKKATDAISRAAKEDAIGAILKLPSTNAGISAAQGARKQAQITKGIDQEEFGTEATLIQHYWDWQHAQSVAQGSPTTAAIGDWMNKPSNLLPGAYGRTLRGAINPDTGIGGGKNALLNPQVTNQETNEELRLSGAKLFTGIVKQQGGIDQVTAGMRDKSANQVRSEFEEATKLLQQAAKSMESAASDTKAAAQSRPALAPALHDPGK